MAKKKNSRLLLRRALLFSLLFFLSLMSLSFIARIPIVQAFGINHITDFLSKSLGTRVEVGEFGTNLFGRLSLDSVYIENPYEVDDTLFFASRLSVQFANPVSLINNRLRIRRINLETVGLHIERPDNKAISSLDYIIDQLSLERRDPNRTPLDLLIDRVTASDLHYTFEDDHQESFSEYGIAGLDVEMDSLNLAQKVASFTRIAFDQPYVSLITNGPPIRTDTIERTSTKDSIQWFVSIENFVIDDAVFKKRDYDYRQFAYPQGVNYHDLEVTDLNFSVCEFSHYRGNIRAGIDRLELKEKSGFELTNATIAELRIEPTGIYVEEYNINSRGSYLGDSLRITFRDISDLTDPDSRMRINAHFDDTRIAINDIMLLAPSTAESAFIQNNKGMTMVISGRISGRPNRLIGEDIYGELGRLTFRGDFRTRDLTVPGQQMLNLRVERADFNTRAFRALFPDTDLPQRFDRLGNMVFSGNFDGYLHDFVAFGNLTTELGSAQMDMSLASGDGAANAEYSGSVQLDSFDLRSWTGSEALGYLSFNAQVREGRGLTAESANAKLNGAVTSLDYRGYSYNDIVLNGALDNNFFNGSLGIEDENAAFTFNGEIDMRGEVPSFDFDAVIDTVNLNALNFTKDTIGFSGNLDITGTIDDQFIIDGYVQASELVITRSRDDSYTIDTFAIHSIPSDDVQISYEIVSDYISGTLEGDAAFRNAVPALRNHLADSYPHLFPKLKRVQDTTFSNVDIVFDLQFNDAEEWLGIIGAKSINFSQVNVDGKIDLDNDLVRVAVASPDFGVGPAGLKVLDGSVELSNGQLNAAIDIDSLDVNNKNFGALSAGVTGDGASLDWRFAIDAAVDTLALDLYGTYLTDTSSYKEVRIDANRSEFFDGNWVIMEDNAFAWDSGYIDFRNFYLTKGKNTISIDDINNKGLSVMVDSFDLSIIDAVWDYDQLNFAGAYALNAQVDNIFDPKTIELGLRVDDLYINDDPYGVLELTASVPEIGEPLDAELLINRPGAHLRASGRYYIPVEGVDPARSGSFNGGIEFDTFPMAFLEYWLGDAIEETDGYGIGSVVVEGDTSGAEMDGRIRIHEASTKVIPLGTRYYINEQDVILTTDLIDLSGITFTDDLGNEANVTGGLTHTLMAQLGLDLTITAPQAVGLDLAKSPDLPFYGYAEGSVEATFRGPVKQPTLVVNATTAPKTKVFIPLAGSGVDVDSRFIRFVDRDSSDVVEDEEQEALTGLNMLINLSITQDAQVDLIFDERTREILRGRGTGNIQMEFTRTGEFTMYGDYEIETGDYLFTALATNKPFTLRPGGRINWSGDPYDALIDIRADYTGLRTSLTTFLQEYLVTASAATQEQARQKTDVNLELLLTGSLLSPNINFNISFPEVRGELSGYVNSKMATLNADQNALNEQVFGLLILGTFLPTNFTSSSATNNFLQVGAYNTVTEFISSQLSYYLSDFLASALEDVGFISSIDVTVGHSRSYDIALQSTDYQEWELSVRNQLFNDRFIVDVGGNYVTDSPVAGTYFAGDYALEYVLTEDRRLKVRFYYRTDETIEGRQNKTGIGLSYRREFDNFFAWLKGLEKEAKRGANPDSVQ